MADEFSSPTEPLLNNVKRVEGQLSVQVDPIISGDEIRSAASASEPYPSWIHAPLVTPQQGQGFQVQQFSPQQSFPRVFDRGQGLDEVEIRRLLIDYVGHRCCWGSLPARKWKIHAVEDCNSYVGTLETFFEERDVIDEVEPYAGGEIDGKESGPEPGPWELDLKSEFPLLFISRKEARVKIPHSEAVQKCSACEGRGEVPCAVCNTKREPGFYASNRMLVCSTCQGRGLLAHSDGSDTICTHCKGEGRLLCTSCQSRGLIKCELCRGAGSLLSRRICIAKWRTVVTRKVSASSNAASVPDEVFHKAKGVQLYNMQAFQCTPANFLDSSMLNSFSSDIIANRAPVPPSARLICERHQITVVPVTRVIMCQHKKSFAFYMIGLSKDIYAEDYPARRCWGLCCCLDWLNI